MLKNKICILLVIASLYAKAWDIVPVIYQGQQLAAYIPTSPEEQLAAQQTANVLTICVNTNYGYTTAYIFDVFGYASAASPIPLNQDFPSEGMGSQEPFFAARARNPGLISFLPGLQKLSAIHQLAPRFQPDRFCKEFAFSICSRFECKHLHLTKQQLSEKVICHHQINDGYHGIQCHYRHLNQAELEQVRKERKKKPKAIIICEQEHESDELHQCRYLHLPKQP